MSDEYEVCGRCNGEGTYTVGLGPPGTDTHTPAGQVPFTRFGPYTCGACLGTGFRKPYRERPDQLFFAVHSSKADQMSFDQIFDAMKLPTKREEPHDHPPISP